MIDKRRYTLLSAAIIGGVLPGIFEPEQNLSLGLIE